MNRADQPAEFDLGNDELDALKGVLGAGTIIEQEKDPGGDLNSEEEECHSAKVIPDR